MSVPAPVPARRLGELPFFEGLSEGFLVAISEAAAERTYPAGATVAVEGDAANEFLLIRSGKVALELVPHDRPRLTVLTLGPGEVFGWSWLVPPHRWRLDARTLKETAVVAVLGGALRAALEERPVDGYRFLARFVPVLAQRLDATRLQVLDVHRP